jgi:hypothetical protein
MAHMSSGLYRDRLGVETENMTSTSSSTRRTAAAYSSSSLSRQEVTSAQHQQQVSSSSRSHYAVSSHVGNGSLVVDNGGGVIQQQQHGHYEDNLTKFKGENWEYQRLIKMTTRKKFVVVSQGAIKLCSPVSNRGAIKASY